MQKSNQPRWKRSKSLPINLSLFGRHRLLKVPQFDCLILGGCDQDRLYWMEGQVTDWVKVAPQGELWVPGFPESIFVVLRKDGFAVTCCATSGWLYCVYAKWSRIVSNWHSWKFPSHLECEVVCLVCDRYSGKFSQSKFIRNRFVYWTQDEALPRWWQEGHWFFETAGSFKINAKKSEYTATIMTTHQSIMK